MPLYLYDWRPGDHDTIGEIPRSQFETTHTGDRIVLGAASASHMVAHFSEDQRASLLTPEANFLNPPPDQQQRPRPYWSKSSWMLASISATAYRGGTRRWSPTSAASGT